MNCEDAALYCGYYIETCAFPIVHHKFSREENIGLACDRDYKDVVRLVRSTHSDGGFGLALGQSRKRNTNENKNNLRGTPHKKRTLDLPKTRYTMERGPAYR